MHTIEHSNLWTELTLEIKINKQKRKLVGLLQMSVLTPMQLASIPQELLSQSLRIEKTLVVSKSDSPLVVHSLDPIKQLC